MNEPWLYMCSPCWTPSHLPPTPSAQDCPENLLSILLWLREWGGGGWSEKKGGLPGIQLSRVHFNQCKSIPPLLSEGHGIFNAWTFSILRLQLVASSCSCFTLMSFIYSHFVIIYFCTRGLIVYLFICLAAQLFFEAFGDFELHCHLWDL